MARKISKEKQAEYEELKKFFVVWQTHLRTVKIFELNHPHHPINMLASTESKRGVSYALAGVKQAINDILEMCGELSPAVIKQVDTFLISQGAIPLSEVMRRQSKVYKAILRRGKIRNDTEFYLISATISNTSLGLTDAELLSLDSMVSAYELQKA